MKKYIWTMMLIVAVVSVLFVGCADQQDGTTNLRVRLRDGTSSRATARGMYAPIGEGLDIYGYILEGTGPNENSLTLTTNSSQVNINGLVIGTWNLVVTAINQQGTMLATGSKSFQLTTKNNTVDIVVDTLIGSGDLRVDFSYGEEVFENIEFNLGIKKQGEEMIDVSNDVLLNLSSSSAQYQTTLDAGVYELTHSIYSNGVKLTGGIDIVRILHNKETYAEVILTIKKETPEPTGLTIQHTFGETISGSITGIDDVVTPRSPLTASFTDEKEGPHSYQVSWYLDGEFLSTGQSVTFSTYTGEHRIDAVAKGDKIGNIGASTRNFKASVVQNGDLPFLVSSITHQDVDKNNTPYYLASITDSKFLRDGRIVISSASGLQVCEVINDELVVLHSYTTLGNGISVASDPYPTQGVSDIVVDLNDNIVITTAKNLSIVVVYQYDPLDGSLTKLSYFDKTNNDKWNSTLSNLVIDEAMDFAYVINRADKRMQTFNYKNSPLTLHTNVKLDTFGPPINDPSLLTMSDDRKKMIVSSPVDNTFCAFRIKYRFSGVPDVLFNGNGEVVASKGSLKNAYQIGSTAYILTDMGIHTYELLGGLSHTYQKTIGSTRNSVYAITIDNLSNRAWSVEKDSGMHIKTFSLLGNVTYDSGKVELNELNNVKISYSPQGNMMSLIGSSSLYLLRLNDN